MGSAGVFIKTFADECPKFGELARRAGRQTGPVCFNSDLVRLCVIVTVRLRIKKLSR